MKSFFPNLAAVPEWLSVSAVVSQALPSNDSDVSASLRQCQMVFGHCESTTLLDQLEKASAEFNFKRTLIHFFQKPEHAW